MIAVLADRLHLTVRSAAGAVLAGLLMCVAVLGLIDVHNTGATVHNTAAAVAGINQLQRTNNDNQNAKDAAVKAQVMDLQAQVTTLEGEIQADTASIAGLTGSNAQLARALEADIAELRAIGLRPVVEVPVLQPAPKASPTTTSVPRPEETTTTTTVPTSTPPTTKCDGLAKLLHLC